MQSAVGWEKGRQFHILVHLFKAVCSSRVVICASKAVVPFHLAEIWSTSKHVCHHIQEICVCDLCAITQQMFVTRQ